MILQLLTGLSAGHVLFLTTPPHPSERERAGGRASEGEKEAGLVQINYSIHLEDSGGKKKKREEEGKWDTTADRGHSLCHTSTVQYDHRLARMFNPTSSVSVGSSGPAGCTRFDLMQDIIDLKTLTRALVHFSYISDDFCWCRQSKGRKSFLDSD